jgi:hypothetical protein
MQQVVHFSYTSILVAAFCLLTQAPAQAGVIATGSDLQGRSWTAVFQQVGGNQLQISLTNTGVYPLLPTLDASYGVLGLFFNIDGDAAANLTPLSAALGPGSSMVGSTTNPGAGWAYNSGQLAVGGASYSGWLIGAGFGIPNGSHGKGNFCTTGCVKLGGSDYAIYPTGFAGGNGSVKAPYFMDTLVFTLSGLPSNFDISAINRVAVQYGTSLTEPHIPSTSIDYPPSGNPVPEPGTAAMIVLAGAAMSAGLWLRKRRQS